MHLNYKRYSAEEFAEDEKFWLWVIEDDAAQDAFWRQYIAQNPEKAKEVEQAKEMVLQLNAANHRLADKKVNLIWEKIQSSMDGLNAKGHTRVTLNESGLN